MINARAWELVRVWGVDEKNSSGENEKGGRDRKGEGKRAGWKRGKTNRIRDRSRLTHL